MCIQENASTENDSTCHLYVEGNKGKLIKAREKNGDHRGLRTGGIEEMFSGFFKKYLFIYLAALGLSCSKQNL